MPSESSHSSAFSPWLQALPLWWRHALADVRGPGRCLPQASLARIEAQVTLGERLHTGQIRVCLETHLPRSYLWRLVWQGTPLPQLIAQRALMLFAKLRVWHTERNNGVLIYVLLAERAIHVVADRGVNGHMAPDGWSSMIAPMQQAFAQGDFEAGLLQAVDAVSQVMARHFAVGLDANWPVPADDMPDAPVLL